MRHWLVIIALSAWGCAPSRPCGAELWHTGSGSAREVVAVGGWNRWDPGADPLQEVHSGAWTTRVEPPPGDYAYMFQVDGKPVRDPYAPLLEHDPNGGPERSVLRVEDCTVPTMVVDDLRASAEGAVDGLVRFLRGDGGPRLDAESVTARTLDGHRLHTHAIPSRGDIELSGRGLSAGKHTVVVSAADEDGTTATLRLPLWVEDSPHTWADGLVYQVMIDRFADASGTLEDDPAAIGLRAGGTLAGVQAQLDAGWFEALGVSALWLSPVYPVPDGTYPTLQGHQMAAYHGYWPTAYAGVEPSIGTEEDLRNLVQSAHAQGIRVVLDVIPNHVHEDHAWWRDHPDRFHALGDHSCICGTPSCPWDEHIETCWFADYMPDLDWETPAVSDAVVQSVVDTAIRWDLDGLRIDAVPMVPRAAVRELTWSIQRALEQGPTDFLLLGETFTGPDGWDQLRHNIGPFGLDSQFDFPFMWALRRWLAWGSADAEDAAAAWETSQASWAGSGATMGLFVGNHDVSRFVSEAAGSNTNNPWTAPPGTPSTAAPYRRHLLAQALVLTLPGLPVIWQGDDVGLAGATDPDCRRPMRFSADDGLNDHQVAVLDVTRTLGQARRCSKALRRGTLSLLSVEGHGWAHLRDAGDGSPAVVLVNGSTSPLSLSFEVPTAALAGATEFLDLLGVRPPLVLAPGGATTVTLPPLSASVLLPASSACATSVPASSLPEDP